MVEFTKKGTLGSILAASRIITETDVQAALEEQARTGCRLGEALINMGIVSQEDVDWALSNQLDIPFIRLKRDLIDLDVIALVPAAMARTFTCIPLFLAGDELNVAIDDPLNRTAIESIERHSGRRVSISVALSAEIMEMIHECYGPDRHENLGFESSAFSVSVLELINSDLSGAKLLDCLLITTLKNQLCTLSLHSLGSRVQIRGRRATGSHEIGTLSSGYFPAFARNLCTRACIIPDEDSVSSGCFGFEYRNRSFEFHVAIMRAPAGDYITIRPRIPERIPERLADLDLVQEQRDAFCLLARAERGMTFFASRAKQERNRSMELMLGEAETEGKTVLVLGEGVGWIKNRFPRVPLPDGASERARLITAALDHDPDILVIEELNEELSLAAACRAALRGVRVLAGLDVRGTRAALRHLQYQQQDIPLSQCINGLISFKGVRCLCTECRIEYTPTAEELSVMGLEQLPDTFFRSNGCDACGESGFRERRVLMDVLPFDDELRRIFRQTGDAVALEGYLSRNCHGIAREGLRLLNEGELSPEEYASSVMM
ncbi:MAG: pilus assembly protein PilB [Desulfuromonadales bacterium]|nr:pilus assembly protein PilB [Desulfuromonadales bacterium]